MMCSLMIFMQSYRSSLASLKEVLLSWFFSCCSLNGILNQTSLSISLKNITQLSCQSLKDLRLNPWNLSRKRMTRTSMMTPQTSLYFFNVWNPKFSLTGFFFLSGIWKFHVSPGMTQSWWLMDMQIWLKTSLNQFSVKLGLSTITKSRINSGKLLIG